MPDYTPEQLKLLTDHMTDKSDMISKFSDILKQIARGADKHAQYLTGTGDYSDAAKLKQIQAPPTAGLAGANASGVSPFANAMSQQAGQGPLATQTADPLSQFKANMAQAPEQMGYPDSVGQQYNPNILNSLRLQAGVTPPEEEKKDYYAPMIDQLLNGKKEESTKEAEKENVQRKLSSAEEKVSRDEQKLKKDKSFEQKDASEENNEEDTDKLSLLAAQQAASNNQFGANILRAGNQINSALNLTPVSNDVANSLEKSANTPIEQFKEKQEQSANSLKIQKLRSEMADEKALSNPNSDISKLARDAMRKLGIPVSDTVSAKNLKASDVNLGKLLAMQETNDTKKFLAEQSKGDKAAAQEIQINRQMGPLRASLNNDPVIKPSSQNLASLNKAHSILNNNSLPLTSQTLADAEQDIASALTLRGLGATEGKIKRTELITIGRQIAELKQNIGNKPVDLRKEAPQIVEQIKKLNNALIEDYKQTINERMSGLIEDQQALYGDDPRYTKRLDAFKKLNTDRLLKGQTNVSIPSENGQDTVQIQDPSTGKIHLIPADKAQDAISAGGKLMQ